MKYFEETTMEEIYNVHKVNFLGAVNLMQNVLPFMIEKN